MPMTVAIVGVVIAALAILLVVVLTIVVFFMYRKMSRLERRLKIEIGKNSLISRNSEIQNTESSRPVEMDNLERNLYNPTQELATPVKAPTYENTKPSQQQRNGTQSNSLNTSGSLPNRTIGEASGNYTMVPDSLPAFLRNEEMLNVPEVTDDVVKTAQKEFDESYARLSMIQIDDNTPVISEGDYVDPQDARNKAASTKTHEKLEQRVSKSKRKSVNGGKSSNQKQEIIVANREDYTEVSDALNDSTVVNINESITTASSMGYRSRTTSDTSPVKKVLRDPVRKANSMKRPEHCNSTSATSQPLKRKSVAKEFVTFDPKGGFKLSAKRSSSDGVPRPAILNDSQRSSDSQTSTDETTSTIVPQTDVGGKHMYAAVDLTAKCRPETDMIRREGVGTPDHYIACV